MTLVDILKIYFILLIISDSYLVLPALVKRHILAHVKFFPHVHIEHVHEVEYIRENGDTGDVPLTLQLFAQIQSLHESIYVELVTFAAIVVFDNIIDLVELLLLARDLHVVIISTFHQNLFRPILYFLRQPFL